MRESRSERGQLGESKRKTRGGDTQKQSETTPGNCRWEFRQVVATLELCRWVAAWGK